MPAQTATDLANLINGSDFPSTVYQASTGVMVTGVFRRGSGGAFDINDNRLRLILSRTDAAQISINSVIEVDDINYTVREKQPGQDAMTLILETTT